MRDKFSLPTAVPLQNALSSSSCVHIELIIYSRSWTYSQHGSDHQQREGHLWLLPYAPSLGQPTNHFAHYIYQELIV